MVSKTYCAALAGIDAVTVQVEADVSNGLPGFDLVGFLASEVKEAKERVRVAIKNSRYQLPSKKITINLSPADIRKEGTAFDLPISVSILSAFGMIPSACIKHRMFIGELSLDGVINPVRGILPMVYSAYQNGIKECFVPHENLKEALVVQGIKIIGVKTLIQTVDYVLGKETILEATEPIHIEEIMKKGNHMNTKLDFSDVCGQNAIKRAVEVAVAGQHNILLMGAPGAGKTMIARRIPTIMPEMTFEECMEVSRIYSVAGKLSDQQSLIVERPFRSPHHTITKTALAGGGKMAKPGEISLANHGVLFLDEFTEFYKSSIEILRQPLEDQTITISRIYGNYIYPASFMLVAAMNPCICGYFPDRNRCRCSNQQIKRYISRISQPILDRIDISAEVLPIEYKDLIQNCSQSGQVPQIDSSLDIKKRVSDAREIQRARYKNNKIYFNSQLEPTEINRYCVLGSKERNLLEKAFDKYKLSARSYHRILKTARTIADLDASDVITYKHLSEALHFRMIDKKFWDIQYD